MNTKDAPASEEELRELAEDLVKYCPQLTELLLKTDQGGGHEILEAQGFDVVSFPPEMAKQWLEIYFGGETLDLSPNEVADMGVWESLDFEVGGEIHKLTLTEKLSGTRELSFVLSKGDQNPRDVVTAAMWHLGDQIGLTAPEVNKVGTLQATVAESSQVFRKVAKEEDRRAFRQMTQVNAMLHDPWVYVRESGWVGPDVTLEELTNSFREELPDELVEALESAKVDQKVIESFCELESLDEDSAYALAAQALHQVRNSRFDMMCDVVRAVGPEALENGTLVDLLGEFAQLPDPQEFGGLFEEYEEGFEVTEELLTALSNGADSYDTAMQVYGELLPRRFQHLLEPEPEPEIQLEPEEPGFFKKLFRR